MKIIIEGAGEVGSHLAKMLSIESNEITVIDSDSHRLVALSAVADVASVEGPSSSIRVMKEAGVEKADLFIAVNPYTSQNVNLVSTLIAKKLGCKKVCARVDDEEYLSYNNRRIFLDLGIDLMFYPEKIAADEIMDILKRTTSTESMDFARGQLQLLVFKLEDDSPLLDMKLAEFTAAVSSDNLQFRVVALSRGDKTVMPRYDTRFKYHDLVFIITKQEGVPQLTGFLGRSNVEVSKVMVMGGGSIGRMLALGISRSMDLVKVIDKDRSRCIALSENSPKNVVVVNGDGRNPDFLLEEGLQDFDAFVALTGNDEANVLACVAAKRFGVSRTVAEVENIEYIRLAEEMGVDAVVNKKLVTAGRIYKMTLSNKVHSVRSVSGTDAEVLEYSVSAGSKITRCALKDMNFPDNAVIGGVIRGQDSFIAVGDTRIEAGDRVAVFAIPESVPQVDGFFK